MGYWWCDFCNEEKSPYHVTFDETCTVCGSPVTGWDDDDPDGPMYEEEV